MVQEFNKGETYLSEDDDTKREDHKEVYYFLIQIIFNKSKMQFWTHMLACPTC